MSRCSRLSTACWVKKLPHTLQEQNKATAIKCRNTSACQQVIRERHTQQETQTSLRHHPTNACMGCMNEHYHLDSGSFVRQLHVNLACCDLGVSSQIWADQYSLQQDHFTETGDSECSSRHNSGRFFFFFFSPTDWKYIFRCKMCQREAVQVWSYLIYISRIEASAMTALFLQVSAVLIPLQHLFSTHYFILLSKWIGPPKNTSLCSPIQTGAILSGLWGTEELTGVWDESPCPPFRLSAQCRGHCRVTRTCNLEQETQYLYRFNTLFSQLKLLLNYWMYNIHWIFTDHWM